MTIWIIFMNEEKGSRKHSKQKRDCNVDDADVDDKAFF